MEQSFASKVFYGNEAHSFFEAVTYRTVGFGIAAAGVYFAYKGGLLAKINPSWAPNPVGLTKSSNLITGG